MWKSILVTSNPSQAMAFGTNFDALKRKRKVDIMATNISTVKIKGPLHKVWDMLTKPECVK